MLELVQALVVSIPTEVVKAVSDAPVVMKEDFVTVADT